MKPLPEGAAQAASGLSPDAHPVYAFAKAYAERATLWLIWAYFLFQNLQYAYRYILKYNSETTSPTYSDTPPAVQVIKYLVFAGVIYLLGILIFTRARQRFNPGMHWALLFCFYFTAAALIGGQYRSPDFIKAFILPVYPFLLLYSVRFDAADFRTLLKYSTLLFLFHMAYSAVQILLFIAVDRLPALAYPNSILVRFGGGWDDPNAFAPFLLPFCIYLFDYLATVRFSWGQLSLLLVSCVLFLWTMSFTAFISAVPLVLFYLVFRNNYKVLLLVMVTGAVAAVIIVSSPLFSLFMSIKEMKAQSVEAHFNWSLEDILTQHPVNLIFGALGSWDVPHIEGDFIFILFNYGMVGLILVSAFWLAALLRLRTYLRMAKDPTLRCIIIGVAAYLLVFFLGNWNLPYFRIIPINVNFWFILFVLLSQDASIRSLLAPEGRAGKETS